MPCHCARPRGRRDRRPGRSPVAVTGRRDVPPLATIPPKRRRRGARGSPRAAGRLRGGFFGSRRPPRGIRGGCDSVFRGGESARRNGSAGRLPRGSRSICSTCKSPHRSPPHHPETRCLSLSLRFPEHLVFDARRVWCGHSSPGGSGCGSPPMVSRNSQCSAGSRPTRCIRITCST